MFVKGRIMPNDWLQLIVQVPIVAALIYLVLKLEDKRQESAKLREQTNQRLIDSLLGLIDDLANRQNPDHLTARQLKAVQGYAERKDKYPDPHHQTD